MNGKSQKRGEGKRAARSQRISEIKTTIRSLLARKILTYQKIVCPHKGKSNLGKLAKVCN